MLQPIAATKGTTPNPPSLNERLNSGSQIPNTLFSSESGPPHKTILSYWQDKVDRMPKIEFGAPATTAVGVKIPGATFIKRTIVSLDNILIREQPARHEGHIDQNNVKNIIASLNRKGFDPTLAESGQGLIAMRLDKDGLVGRVHGRDKEFELKGGFHRYFAQDKIRKDEGTPDNKWAGYTIVDVYEYETPLAQALHAGGSNCHVNTNKPANKNDICVQVSYNVAQNILGANLKDITAFVEIVGCHMAEKARKSVVQTAMSRLDVSTAGGRVLSLIPDHDITNPGHVVHFQVKFDLPYRGKGNGPQVTNSYGDLATYISDEGGTQKALTLGLGWWAAAGYPTDRYILAALYINTGDLLELYNNPRALQVLRKKWRKKFDASLEVWIQERIHWDRMLLDESGGSMTDKELEAHVRAKCPVRFVGFFPQHVAPSSIKGGLPTETTMVDENGDPFDYKILLGRK